MSDTSIIINHISALRSIQKQHDPQFYFRGFSADELVQLRDLLGRLVEEVKSETTPRNIGRRSHQDNPEFLQFLHQLKTNLSRPRLTLSSGKEIDILLKDLSNSQQLAHAQSKEEKLDILTDQFNRISISITSTAKASFFLHFQLGRVCNDVLDLSSCVKESTNIFHTRFKRGYGWGARHAQLYRFVSEYKGLLRGGIVWSVLDKHCTNLFAAIGNDSKLKSLLEGSDEVEKDEFEKDESGKDEFEKDEFEKDEFEKDESGKDESEKDEFEKDEFEKDEFEKDELEKDDDFFDAEEGSDEDEKKDP